jgi:hypothetical protein
MLNLADPQKSRFIPIVFLYMERDTFFLFLFYFTTQDYRKYFCETLFNLSFTLTTIFYRKHFCEKGYWFLCALTHSGPGKIK